MKKSKDPRVAAVAGALAGAVEAVSVWPSEVVKTKLQLQSTSAPVYRGAVHCVVSSVQKDGFLSLYRGLTPIVLMALPKAGVRFSSYSVASSMLTEGGTKPSRGRSFLAGLCAGAMEATLVVTPQETLKVRLIDANRPFLAGTVGIMRTEGLRGIYRGWLPTLLKQSSNQGVRFVSYGEFMAYIRRNEPAGSDVKTSHAVLGGMFAGSCSVMANNPVDVVKTRMQSEAAARYSSSLHCVKDLIVSEGPLALYKGALSRLARVLPGQGILFGCYESVTRVAERFVLGSSKA